MKNLTNIRVLEHQDVLFDPHGYYAHPHVCQAVTGDLVMVVSKTMRREHLLHPPEDPYFHNLIIRSSDGGRTWSSPQIAPDFNWFGMECASVTALRDGRVALVQCQIKWWPLDLAQRSPRKSSLIFPDRFYSRMAATSDLDEFSGCYSKPEVHCPWAKGDARTFVHFSDDHGRTFTEAAPLELGAIGAGFSIRGITELPNGDLYLLLNELPDYEFSFAVRSNDGGRTWSAPERVASHPDYSFGEPVCLALNDGRLLAMFREERSRRMFQSVSIDLGRTWSFPQDTGIPEFPADLKLLPDGRIACIAGRRLPPFGVMITLSDDNGRTWDLNNAITIRGDLSNKDCGYPNAVILSDGTMIIAYYGRNRRGETGIMLSRIALD